MGLFAPRPPLIGVAQYYRGSILRVLSYTYHTTYRRTVVIEIVIQGHDILQVLSYTSTFEVTRSLLSIPRLLILRELGQAQYFELVILLRT